MRHLDKIHSNVDFLTIEYLKDHFVKSEVTIVNEELDSNPLVSVLFITYNHLDYIKESLEGILNQVTSFNLEILIGDDESTDGTREICIDYAKKYPERIKLFLHKRENNIAVLNKPSGIFQITYNILSCRGKYIAICSGDDIWTDKHKLQKQFDLLEINKKFILSYHPFVRYAGKLQSINVDKLKICSDTAKASTMFFRNISDVLPINFIDAIQEDVFLWHILRFQGEFASQLDIEPTIICTPPSSVSRSLDEQQNFLHSLNINIQIFNCIDVIVKDKNQKNFICYNLIKMLFNRVYNFRQKKYLLKILIKILSLKDVLNVVMFRTFHFDEFKNYLVAKSANSEK